MKRRDHIKRTMRAIALGLGCTYAKLTARSQDQATLLYRYIAVQILKEEGYKTYEIIEEFPYSNHAIVTRFRNCFDDLIAHNRTFKTMYLKAVKAVEDQDNDD